MTSSDMFLFHNRKPSQRCCRATNDSHQSPPSQISDFTDRHQTQRSNAYADKTAPLSQMIDVSHFTDQAELSKRAIDKHRF
jgi:hypothetical protein